MSYPIYNPPADVINPNERAAMRAVEDRGLTAIMTEAREDRTAEAVESMTVLYPPIVLGWATIPTIAN